MKKLKYYPPQQKVHNMHSTMDLVMFSCRCGAECMCLLIILGYRFVMYFLQTVFKVDRADFAKMPYWKQTKRKKEVGLF